MWIYLQYSELSMLKNACENARPQRQLWNFSPVQNWNCPSKRRVDGSLTKTLMTIPIINFSCNRLINISWFCNISYHQWTCPLLFLTPLHTLLHNIPRVLSLDKWAWNFCSKSDHGIGRKSGSALAHFLHSWHNASSLLCTYFYHWCSVFSFCRGKSEMKWKTTQKIYFFKFDILKESYKMSTNDWYQVTWIILVLNVFVTLHICLYLPHCTNVYI